MMAIEMANRLTAISINIVIICGFKCGLNNFIHEYVCLFATHHLSIVYYRTHTNSHSLVVARSVVQYERVARFH